MKATFPFLLLCILTHMLLAQAPTRLVFSSIGSSGTAGGYQYSYTVGEAFGHVLNNSQGALTLTMGFQQPTPPLPLAVEGLYLSAKWEKQDALLMWETTREDFSSHFVVERSVDGSSFTPIGEVAAAGFSDGPSHYTFLDQEAAGQRGPSLLYRLQKVDMEGAFTYSQVVTLTLFAPQQISVELYPNPTTDQAFLRYRTTSESTGTVLLSNTAGQQLWNTHISSGSGVLEIPVTALPAGTYVVSFLQEAHAKSFRLIIAR